jgi:ribose transport system permease protein
MMMVTKGKSVNILDKSFLAIGQGRLFDIQYPVYYLIILVVVFELLLRRSRAFRVSYYVGGNENAAKLNGINVNKVKIFNYMLVGVLAGLSGIVLSARLSTASVGVGASTALEVITACIIGGASLSGGEGSVLGAFLGVVFIQIVQQSLNMMDLGDLGPYIKIFATGLILLFAITLDVLNERRKGKKLIALKEKQILEKV